MSVAQMTAEAKKLGFESAGQDYLFISMRGTLSHVEDVPVLLYLYRSRDEFHFIYRLTQPAADIVEAGLGTPEEILKALDRLLILYEVYLFRKELEQ